MDVRFAFFIMIPWNILTLKRTDQTNPEIKKMNIPYTYNYLYNEAQTMLENGNYESREEFAEAFYDKYAGRFWLSEDPYAECFLRNCLYMAARDKDAKNGPISKYIRHKKESEWDWEQRIEKAIKDDPEDLYDCMTSFLGQPAAESTGIPDKELDEQHERFIALVWE